MRECEACLVLHYKEDYLYTHARAMVVQEEREDLGNLFLLLQFIPKSMQPVVAMFEEHVKEQGTVNKLVLASVGVKMVLILCLLNQCCHQILP